MSPRAIRITARIAFFVCGLIALLTAVPYALLRGAELPVEWEWVVFVVALAVVGGLSLTAALIPQSWIAKACHKERDDLSLFSRPFILLGGLAAAFYLIAAGLFFVPRSWNLNPQLMLSLCPMCVVKLTIDPRPLPILLILAPMNAAAFGALGVSLGYALLAFRARG